MFNGNSVRRVYPEIQIYSAQRFKQKHLFCLQKHFIFIWNVKERREVSRLDQTNFNFQIHDLAAISSDWAGRNEINVDHLLCFRKLREEYDKLEGALKKLGVDPDCVVTEEEDGYNAESDLEDDTEQDCEREVATFVPAVYNVDPSHRRQDRQPGAGAGLARVDEVRLISSYCVILTLFSAFFK